MGRKFSLKIEGGDKDKPPDAKDNQALSGCFRDIDNTTKSKIGKMPSFEEMAIKVAVVQTINGLVRPRVTEVQITNNLVQPKVTVVQTTHGFVTFLCFVFYFWNSVLLNYILRE